MRSSWWNDLYTPEELKQISEEFDRHRQEKENLPINKYSNLWSLFQELAPEAETKKLEIFFNRLIERYEEVHRGYHDVDHLLDLSTHFEEHEEKFSKDRKAVIAALFYHDAIYECQPGEDEIQSASYMRSELENLGVAPDIIDRAEELILRTADHDAPKDDYVARLFLDMDMSILGARFDVYDNYLDGVAKEFCIKHNISRQQFDQARLSMFVDPTLQKGRIFSTEEYKPYESIALQNLQREKQSVSVKYAGKPEKKP